MWLIKKIKTIKILYGGNEFKVQETLAFYPILSKV